jgi:hypothetical protein
MQHDKEPGHEKEHREEELMEDDKEQEHEKEHGRRRS